MLALGAMTVAHSVIEITSDNPPNKALEEFEFAVINFYDASSDSPEVNKIFQAAMVMF